MSAINTISFFEVGRVERMLLIGKILKALKLTVRVVTFVKFTVAKLTALRA